MRLGVHVKLSQWRDRILPEYIGVASAGTDQRPTRLLNVPLIILLNSEAAFIRLNPNRGNASAVV